MENHAPVRTAPTVNRATVVGRISAVRRHGDTHYTRVQLPNGGDYDYGGTVEIASRRSLGQQDDEIEQAVTITGRSRRFTTREGDTATAVDVRLNAVE